jgi:hypothetical protein
LDRLLLVGTILTVDEPEAPSETAHPAGQAAPEFGSASVVLASFKSSQAAEHMVASLGRGFRKEARGGGHAVFVVTRNKDESFRLHHSRVITASGVSSAVVGVTVATFAGFMGLGSSLKGAKVVTQSGRDRKSHVRDGGRALAEFLDRVGPNAACVLIQCADEETGRTVAARATERGSECWNGSRTEFLALLDQLDDDYDWLRPAASAEPTPKKKKRT